MIERKGVSLKEASLRGAEVSRKKKRKRIDEYNLKPFLCKYCKNPISYEKRRNKFCSHSCSATLNNLGIVRNEVNGQWKKKACKKCGTMTRNKKYCSTNCCGLHKKEQRRNRITEIGSLIDYKKDKWYLIEIRSHKCETCYTEKWMWKPIPLDIHHKDGNSDNNIFDNLSLTCPNCHRQTDNYGSKNKGNDRHSKRAKYRKDRYDKGLSY